MAGEDRAYTDRVAQLACAARSLSRCNGPVQVHHRSTGRNRRAVKGADRRAHDHDSIPLCMGHHTGDWHGYQGAFEGWSREQRTDWEDAQIAQTRAWLGLQEQGASDGPDDRPDRDTASS